MPALEQLPHDQNVFDLISDPRAGTEKLSNRFSGTWLQWLFKLRDHVNASTVAPTLHAATHQAGGTDPLTAIAAAIITGTLTKAQQDVLTAYTDVVNVFTETQHMPAGIWMDAGGGFYSVFGGGHGELYGPAASLKVGSDILHYIELINGGVRFPTTNIPSADANVLDDYEEGIFTPYDASGAGLTFVFAAGTYVKVGQALQANFQIIYPVTADGLPSLVGGLPFTTANANCALSVGFQGGGPANLIGYAVGNSSTFQPMIAVTGVLPTNAQLSGMNVVYSGSLRTAT